MVIKPFPCVSCTMRKILLLVFSGDLSGFTLVLVYFATAF